MQKKGEDKSARNLLFNSVHNPQSLERIDAKILLGKVPLGAPRWGSS